MTMISKIADRHLSRRACIYIRQSTLAQVRSNQESTDRQYNLLNKAQSLAGSDSRSQGVGSRLITRGPDGAPANFRSGQKVRPVFQRG